jgi:prepilin-type N-terminal cleavage/methylation domain-containing protein
MPKKIHARRVNSGCQAFTLIEVMIATVITAIIFMAVQYGISTGFLMVELSREQLRADQVCLARMEGVRLCNWDTQLFNNNIVPSTFTDYYYPVGLGGGTNGVVYYGTMQFSGVNLSPAPSYAANMRLLTVTVTWTNALYSVQEAHVVTMKTYVGRYGVQTYVYTH